MPEEPYKNTISLLHGVFAEVYRLEAVAKFYENETIRTDRDDNLVC